MNPRALSLVLLGWSLLPLPSSVLANPVPPALADDLTRFVTEEPAFQPQDDAARVARFCQFSLQDEGRPGSAREFRRARTEYAKAFAPRSLQSLDGRFLSADTVADTVALQQTHGLEAQPQGHTNSERRLPVRPWHVVHASEPTRAADQRSTGKRLWTCDARLSSADHFQPGRPPRHLADDVSHGGGTRDAVNAVILQDRAGCCSGHRAGRDHGTPRVRVSFSDNGRGGNRDGCPVLDVGVLDP